jgi:hypothetical protein
MTVLLCVGVLLLAGALLFLAVRFSDQWVLLVDVPVPLDDLPPAPEAPDAVSRPPPTGRCWFSYASWTGLWRR